MVFINPYAQAYTILNSKTEVSPGYEGGILSQSTISTIHDPYKSEESGEFATESVEPETHSSYQFDSITEN